MEPTVYAFVVLHYGGLAFTEQCVASLRALADAEHLVRIVLVDNGSPDGSGVDLVEAYGDDDDVVILLSDENLGFSKANNLGYAEALRIWSPRAVLVVNNDITIDQPDFFAVLDEDLAQETYYVVGPDVYVRRNDVHQSPWRQRPVTMEEVDRWMAVFDDPKRRFTLWRKGMLIRMGLYKPLQAVYAAVTGDDGRPSNVVGWDSRAEGCVLQGAALIFTDLFIAAGQLPFEPEVFLYAEEDILGVRCANNGWPVLYDPRLQVIHYDDGSTDAACRDFLKKQEFVRERHLESLPVLRRLVEQAPAGSDVTDAGL